MEGKTILVTGAARRLGSAVAREMHTAGARVMLHYRKASGEAEALVAELNALRPDSAACVQADLLAIDTLPQLVADTVERFGSLDALVNNASSFFSTRFGSIDSAAWDDLVGTNFKAPLFLT